MTSETKRKLRTAGDVISRLRWSSEQNHGTYVLGYDDRIHGPMEKALEDYVPIAKGGDIPEHRIWYIRSTENPRQIDQSVLWDRIGRVDRIFSSGNGANTAISPVTLEHVTQAIKKMAQLDLEKQERRELKEKERARKARKRAAKAAALNFLSNTNKPQEQNSDNQSTLRYSWVPTPWYTYSEEVKDWKRGSDVTHASTDPTVQDMKQLTVVTWNVLFDLYDNELDDSHERWSLISTHLSRTNADIIALQEVTPPFVSSVLSQPWVKELFASTASPIDTDTVTPSGNLLLWRKTTLVPLSLDLNVFVCVDSFRRCSVMAILKTVTCDDADGCAIAITNVHLLANKKEDNQTGGSRALARRRELASVIGQMQKIEQRLLRDGQVVQPIIIGDFNTSDQVTDLTDGSFSGYSNGCEGLFVDVWPMVQPKQPGYTFDPTTNVRARRTQSLTDSSGGSKRLDRMYLAQLAVEVMLQPIAATLLGHEERDQPPSDHYGVSYSCKIMPKSLTKEGNAFFRRPGINGWAANAMPTPDTLLALVLDESHELGTHLYDSSSSLPVPHITLLHGFVELSSCGFREFAVQAVRDAMVAIHAESGRRMLCFTESSLNVFEHRASATLIARPDTNHPSTKWLFSFYKSLTSIFRQCHEQESRFSEGWTPHVSLGTFGTSVAARSEAASRVRDGRWTKTEKLVPIHGVAIFQRNPSDGKFYDSVSIPFESGPSRRRELLVNKLALRDSLSTWSSNFKGVCSGVVWELQRACQAAAGDDIETRVRVSGSFALDAALPFLSDVDAVVEARQVRGKLPAEHRSENDVEYLREVALCIKSRYPMAKCRVRTAATAGGATLRFLTLKLWDRAPAVDLILCRCNNDGSPLDEPSRQALNGADTHSILYEKLRSACADEGVRHDIVAIFAGALRIIKLWAYRRDVYGSNVGYLGGGAWAILLARTMLDGLQDGTVARQLEKMSLDDACHFVVKAFFRATSQWTVPLSISVNDEDEALHKSTAQPMVIASPCGGGDFSRSMNMATAFAVMDELKYAASVLPDESEDLSTVMCHRSLAEFLSLFQSIMLVTVAIPKDKTNFVVSDLKGWACQQLLYLTVGLQHALGDASAIRPRPSPLRAVTPASFVWLVGMRQPVTQELLDIVDAKSSGLQHQWDAAFSFDSSVDTPSIQCLNVLDATEHLESLGVQVMR